MKYLDIIIVILYLVALVVIIVEFSGLWALATVLLLILIICSLQKSYFDRLLDGTREQKNKIFEIIANKLDVFYNSIEAAKNQMEQNSIIIENKLSEMGTFDKTEFDNTYRELTRKIFDVENKLSVVKKTLGMTYSVVDERLQAVERVLNLRHDEEEKTF